MDEIRSSLDVVVLTESRWRTDRDWSDRHWHYASFGRPSSTHAGILVMINKQNCQPQSIATAQVYERVDLHILDFMLSLAPLIVAWLPELHQNCSRLDNPIWDALDQKTRAFVRRVTSAACATLRPQPQARKQLTYESFQQPNAEAGHKWTHRSGAHLWREG